MTAMYPDTKPWDFTFLNYLKNPSNQDTNILPKYPSNPNSVLAFIATNPDFSDFYQITKIADMEKDLDGDLKGFTLFVPISCNGLDLLRLDRLEARKIVMLSMLPAKLYRRDMITGLFDTYLKNYHMWIDESVLNKRSRVVLYNVSRDNGVVHVVDRLPML